MEKSTNYNFNLPNSANDEMADINDISDNFRIIDEIMKETDQTYSPTSANAQSGKAVAEAVTAEQKRADNTFANALKGSKSGSAILIDDVSPVTHDMRVKISSDIVTDLTAVKVSRCGKNLIPYPYYETTKTVDGTLTFTDNGDGSVTVNGTTSVDAYFTLVNVASSNVSLPSGQVFTLSGCPSGGSDSSYRILGTSGGPNNTFLDYGNGASFTSNGRLGLLLTIFAGATVNNLTFRPQIELGTTVTEYEPYNGAEYTPTADGTVEGVTSLYPNTNLITGTDGVLIDCEYNRDINKAFAELQAAIISSGGNV